MQKISEAFIVIAILIGGIILGYAAHQPVPASSTTKTLTIFTSYTVTQTTTLAFSPFNQTEYLDNSVGCTSDNGVYGPCWSYNESEAYKFNCIVEAASLSGCSRLIVDPSNPDLNYTITFWLPPRNHTAIAPHLNYTILPNFWYPENYTAFPYDGWDNTSWTNCMYGQTIPVGLEHEEWLFYSYCAPISSIDFIVTQPSPFDPPV
jgi:hypothetical protein